VTLAEFKESTAQARPPERLAPALIALWWDAKGDWERAHGEVMDEADTDCAWVHAYLHRREGDLANARYWYGQARKPAATGTLDAEWDRIARTLLGEGA